jgi:hypothetical protein
MDRATLEAGELNAGEQPALSAFALARLLHEFIPGASRRQE